MSRRMRTPSYRLHKPSGQAVVTLDGHDVYLGKHDTPESRTEYDRLIAEWLANGRRLPARCGGPSESSLTVNELALANLKWAEAYYGFKDGRKGTSFNIKDVLRLLKNLYGHTRAADFGPLALKACRAEMVKKDWSRAYINAQVDRIRRIFKWAASEQLLPVTSCWVYRPGSDQGEHSQHKTAHHDHERLILIGPRAQEILRPFLGTKLDAYCFSPAESERQRSEVRRAARQTSLTPSQKARKTKAKRKRAPQERCPVTSYRNAIYRACDRAFPLPEPLAPRLKEDGKRESRAAWWARLTAEEREAVRI